MESKEVLELIHKAKAGNNEATEKLIEQYLNAVRKINNKWGGTDDGFQEGILGIYEAMILVIILSFSLTYIPTLKLEFEDL